MNTAELRLGNLVLDKNGEPQKVIEISEYGLKVGLDKKAYRTYASDFKPILLTEDWLIRLRFEEMSRSDSYVSFLDEMKFAINHKLEDGDKFESGFYTGDWQRIDYVHQLQNLYYALTGKELKRI